MNAGGVIVIMLILIVGVCIVNLFYMEYKFSHVSWKQVKKVLPLGEKMTVGTFVKKYKEDDNLGFHTIDHIYYHYLVTDKRFIIHDKSSTYYIERKK